MIFVFGNASFQGGTLGWTALESWLVTSLKSLGFLVVFEYKPKVPLLQKTNGIPRRGYKNQVLPSVPCVLS